MQTQNSDNWTHIMCIIKHPWPFVAHITGSWDHGYAGCELRLFAYSTGAHWQNATEKCVPCAVAWSGLLRHRHDKTWNRRRVSVCKSGGSNTLLGEHCQSGAHPRWDCSSLFELKSFIISFPAWMCLCIPSSHHHPPLIMCLNRCRTWE